MGKKTKVEEFLKKCKDKHGDKYDYSGVIEYFNGTSTTTLLLNCEVHGEFTVNGKQHLRGVACNECSKINRGMKGRSNTEAFVQKAISKFGNRFDYEEVNYVKNSIPVKIRCIKHNYKFEQTPNVHIHPDSAGGCILCANEATSMRCRKTTEKFISDSVALHGEIYDYSRINYKTIHQKVEIGCKNCKKWFWQFPSAHCKTGHGCPTCANYGYRGILPGYLYILKSSDLTKIGVTNTKPSTRAFFINKETGKDFRVYEEFLFQDGYAALNIETEMLRYLNSKYNNSQEKFNGYTECFHEVDLEELSYLIKQRIRELNILNNE